MYKRKQQYDNETNVNGAYLGVCVWNAAMRVAILKDVGRFALRHARRPDFLHVDFLKRKQHRRVVRDTCIGSPFTTNVTSSQRGHD